MNLSSVVLVGRAYQNFVNSLASSESRQQYIYVLKKYMELGAKNFDELIRQDPRDYRATNHRLNDIPSRLVKGHKVPKNGCGRCSIR